MRKSLRHLAAATLLVAACAKPGNLPVASVEATVPGGTAPWLLTVATGSTVHLDAGKSQDSTGKVDGALTYEWRILEAPRGSQAKIESPANKVTRFTPDIPSRAGGEDYKLQLVVRTQYYASAPALLKIIALDCGVNAPVTGTLVGTPSSSSIQRPVALSAPGVDDKDNSPQCQPQLHGLQTLRYAWSIVDLPAGSQTRLSDPRAVAPAFVPDVAGTYTAQLVVTDSTGRSSAPGQIAIDVAPCGGALPLIDAVAFTSSPVSPNLGQPTQLLAKVGDADSGATCNIAHRYSYKWSIVSLPKGSQMALNNSAVVAPSFTPDVEGDYRFRLVVTNERGLVSAPSDHGVTAKACGSAAPLPTLSFQPASVGIGTPVQFDVKVDDADASCGISETFSYRWSLVTVPTGSFAQLNNTSASRPSFTPDQGGDYLVGLQVTDSNGTSASASAHVTVKTCGNSVPIIVNLQGIPAAPLVGSPVALVQTVSDTVNSTCPGYDATQTFRWSMVTRPAGSAASLVDPTAASTRFTPDVAGSYQVQLVVTNAAGIQSAPSIATISTGKCGASLPTITATAATPANPDPGSVVSLFANPDDVDNSCGLPQALSLQWAMVSRPFGSNAALSNPSAARPTFTPDKVGSYQFTVTALAANGLRSAPTWLTVATTACGTGVPSVAASPASLALLPHDSVTFTTTPAESASCANTLPTFSYSWQIVSAPTMSSAVLSNPASPGPSFSPVAAGDYVLQVAVTDDKGVVSLPAFVHLTVSTCASLGPAVDYLTSTAGGIGLPVSLQAHAVIDRNCLAQASANFQYLWQLTSRPPSSQAVVANPSATQTGFTPDVPGAYQVQLVVTDGLGLASLPVYRTVSIAPCTSSTIAWDPATPITASYVEPDGSTGTPLAYQGSVVTLGTRLTDSSPACNALATAPYSYRWALVARPAGSGAKLSSASAAGPALVPDVPGDYQVAAVVTDALGTVSAPAFFIVHTESCGANLPQVSVSPAGSQSVNTLSLQAVQVLGLSATDADSVPASCPARFAVSGFTYAWTFTSATTGSRAQLSSATGTNTSFEALTPGTYSVQVVATASNGRSSAPASVDFVAGACGSHAPVVLGVSTLAGGVATSRPAIGQAVRLTAAASDADITTGCTDSLTYRWSLVSEPAGSLVNGPADSSTNAFFDFTPDVAGTYAFTVVATDSTGLSSAPFPVSVTTGTCGPTFGGALKATNSTPGVGTATTVSAPAISDACVQNASFSYAWSIATRPAGSSATLATPGAASTAFIPGLQGSYVLQLVVTDGGGFSSAPAQVTLTAGSCGALPPALGAVSSSIATPDIGDAVTLSVPLTDLNAACAAGRTQPYVWQWALISAPAHSHAALSSTTDAAPALVPDAVGAYQLSVVATDALGNISAPQFLTLVTSNCGAQRPTVAIAPQPVGPATQLQVNELAPLALTATAADADNSCPLRFHTGFTYAWSVITAPAGASSALSAPTAQSTNFAAATAGSYLVQVIAASSSGFASAPATVAISTLWCGGNAPAVMQVTTQVSGVASSRPAVGSAVTLTATALDPDNVPGGVCSPALTQAISYAWTLVSTPSGANLSAAGANAAAFSFTPAVAGTYVFSVIATDSTGLSSPPFTVTVPTGSCGPNLTGISVNAGAGQTVNLAHLPATLSDACVAGGSLSYAWSVLSRPATSGAGLAAPSAEAQSFTPDVPGTYQLQLVVTDSGGFSTAATTAVTAGGCAAGPALVASSIVASPAAPFRDDAVHLSIPAAAITGSCGNGQLSYEWALVSRPAASQAQLDAANVPSPSFTADVAGGVWQAMLIVRDSLGNASAPQFATVTASSCGAALPVPVVSVAPSSTPYTFAPVRLTASTPDPNATCPVRFQSAGFTYAWSIASQPPGAPAPQLVSSGATAQLTALAPGAYQVAVVATGTFGSSSAKLLTTVTAQQCGYNAPTVGSFRATQAGSGLAAPATLDDNLDVVLGATAVDVDNTVCNVSPAQTATLAWTLVAKPAGSAAQLRFPSAAAPVITPDLPGAYSMQLVATDSTGLTGSGIFSFTASATCGLAAPIAQAFSALQTLPAGAPISITGANNTTTSLDLGYPVQLGATVTDGDAACGLVETVSYAWTLAAPAGSRATLAGAATAAPGFVPDVVGTYTLALTLTDSTGLRSTSTFAVKASCGAAPPMALDGVNPAFKAQQSMPSIVTTNLGTGPLQITSSTLGSSAIAFYAGTPVQLSANVVDADAACGYPAETITYAWSFAKAPAGSIARFVNAAAPAPTFVPDLAGEYDVQLTLTDSTGRSTTQLFAQANGNALVGVSGCGAQLPTAQIGIDGPRTLAAPVTSTPVLFTGSTVLLNGGTSSSPDTQPLDVLTGAGCGLAPTLSYAWSFVTAAPGHGDFTSPTLSNPGFIPGADGLFTVQLVVSEGAHQSFPAQVAIRASSPSAAKSTFTAVPNDNIVADGVATSLLTATAIDSAGNPIAGVPGTISAVGNAITLVQANPATDVTGAITATLASTRAKDLKTASAQLGALALPPVTVRFVPGTATQVVWTLEPRDSVQNKTIVNTPGPSPVAPAVTIEDAQGNPILPAQDGAAATLTVALGPNPPVSSAQLKYNGAACPCTLVATNGKFVFDTTHALTITKLGTGYTVLVTGDYVNSTTLQSVSLAQALSFAFNIIPPPPPPTAPTGLAAVPGVQSVQLTWTQYGDLNITGYNLLRTNPDSSTTQIGGLISGTTFPDTNLLDGSTYGYQVRAVNSGGPGPYSTLVAATTAPPPPVLTGLAPGVSSAIVSWNAAPAATRYNLQRSTSQNGTYVVVAANLASGAVCSAGACQATDSGLTNETSYFYQVDASNAGGTQTSASAGPVIPTAAPDVNHSGLTLAATSPNPVVADNTNGAKLLVTALDGAGQPIANTPVTFQSSSIDPGDSFSTTSGFTNGAGQFATTLQSQVADAKTFVATVGPSGGTLKLTLVVQYVGGAATQLAFVGQPGDTFTGQQFGASVAALDAFNNPTGRAGTITVALANGGTATLSGTNTVALQTGVASFVDLSINQALLAGKLHATSSIAGVGTADSAPFNVAAAPVASVYGPLAASQHTCSITAGKLSCWGPNASGQLGNGTTTPSASPVRVGIASDWTAIANGNTFSCGLRGTALFCWGDNTYGQLGLGGTGAPALTPQQVAPATAWTRITAGDFHACATDNFNALYCWGNNQSSQLGIAPASTINHSVAAPAGPGPTTADNAGPELVGQTFKATLNGNLIETDIEIEASSNAPPQPVFIDIYAAIARGTPVGGVLGTSDPIAINSLPPTTSAAFVPGGTKFTFSTPVAVTAGNTYAMVLRTAALANGSGIVFHINTSNPYPDGSYVDNFLGGPTWFTQLSWSLATTTIINGTPPQVAAPTRISVASWTAVSAGGQHTCGLQGNSLFCFGLNLSGQIGIGNVASPVQTPALVGAAGEWASIASGSEFTCATKTSGAAFCWGRNDNGQLGSAAPVNQSAPVQVGALIDWTQVSAGFSHACGRHTDNSISCWGANANGELGDGTLVGHQSQSTVAGGPWSTMAAGFQYTCAVSTAGAISCWGNDAADALGTGSATQKPAPVRVDPRDFRQVVAGSLHTCALRTDGTAWCSGSNARGQLGDGTLIDRSAWTAVAGGQSFSTLTASANDTCGITSGGALWCWGQNDQGQVGDGTSSVDRSAPVQVGTSIDWKQISTGGTHACGMRGNNGLNSIYCWGSNASGDLGDATVAFNSFRSTPGPLVDSGYALAVAGSAHSCGVKGGGLFCWGANDVGELAQAAAVAQSTSPVQVGALNNWTGVAAGSQHGCALQANQLSCWGGDSRGQVGNGGFTSAVYAPSAIAGSWTSVSPGPLSTCAIGTGGTLSCWGANDRSQLGLGDTADRPSPAQVGTAANWASVATGLSHSCGVRTDGSLWCWGLGASGQLGDGGPSRVSPTPVFDPSTAPNPTGTPSANNSTLNLSRGALPADGTTTTAITVVVKDQFGAAVANQPVTVTVDGSNNTLVVSGAVTDGAGTLVATLASTTAQLKTITAAVGSFNLNAAALFQSRPAGTATSTLTLGQTRALSGTLVSVTVLARDVSGNPVAGQSVLLTSDGPAATFAAANGFTDANGSYLTTISSPSAENDNLTATIGAAAPVAAISFFGPASQVVFLQSPVNATPGTTIGAFSVAIEDALGNAMTNLNTSTGAPQVVLAIGNNPGAASLTPAASASANVVNGVASFSGLFVSAVGQGYTLTASSGALSPGTSASFNINAPWTLTKALGGTVNDVKMDPTVTSAPAAGYAATTQGVFSTTDGGATWTAYTTGMGAIVVNALAVDKNGLVYAGTVNGVYARAKAGASWAAVNGAGPDLKGSVKAIVVGTNNTARLWAITTTDVYLSSDSAASWTAVSSGLPVTATSTMSALTVDPTTASHAFIAYNDGNGVWRSSVANGTGNVSWADRGLLANTPVNALAIDSTATNLYAATQGRDLYILAGNTWTQANTGALPSPVRAMTSLVLQGAQIFAGFADGEVFSSTAATVLASGWSAAGTGLLAQSITALAADPTSTASLFSVQPNALIYQTTNSGTAWSASSNGIAAQVNAIAIDPATPTRVYAATTRLGVQISNDSSATFADGNAGFAGVTQVVGIAFDTQNSLVWAATNAGPYSSPLGAAPAWTAKPITGNPRPTGIAADAFGNIYVSTVTGLYSGTGASWSAVLLPASAVMPLTSVAGDPNGKLVLVGASNGAYRFSFGGAFQLANGTLVPGVTSFVLDSAALTVYAAAPTGVFKSASKGDNMFAVTPAGISSPFTTVAFQPAIPNSLYAASNGAGVFRTTDGGTTWTAASIGLDLATTGLAVDPTTLTRVYAGSATGAFFQTSTGGL